jgi:hypothetical protein
MKRLLIPVIFLSSYLISCGPAAEDRKRMDYVARRNSDSIAKWLDSALVDPQKELGVPVTIPGAPAPVDATKK